MSRFFTADLHFGHKNIRDYITRPWATNDEMREGLIERWNAVVKPEDEIWCLGDLSFGGAGYTGPIIARLNGTKHLIRGNHDGYPDRRYVDWGFKSCQKGSVELLLSGHFVILCHYPYHGDHTPGERYLDRRPVDSGQWLLHGHVHNEWKVRDRQINVGVDVWDWAPVSEQEILKIVELSMQPTGGSEG